MMGRNEAVGYHDKRMYDGQELPLSVTVKLADSLAELGGPVNGLPERSMTPNCHLETMSGEVLPAVWYLNAPIQARNRIACAYMSVDELGNPKEYTINPAAWVLTEGRYLPLVLRLLRVIDLYDLNLDPAFLSQVEYNLGTKTIAAEQLGIESAETALTSLGAAGNPFNVVYLLTDAKGRYLPSPAREKWMILDPSSVGYKTSCGISERIYGPGCYFGGLWSCATRGAARKVDQAVCKVKNPPWKTKYFWVMIDDLVFSTNGGSSIKAGRMKFVNEDQDKRVPDWVSFG